MYPTFTWQQEALAIIKAKYNIILHEDEVTFALGAHETNGALQFTIYVDTAEHVYTRKPLPLNLIRRDISKLFVGFTPEISAHDGETYGAVLTRTLEKYGLNIPANNFSASDLMQTVAFGTGDNTVLHINIDQTHSELWFGTITVRARAGDTGWDNYKPLAAEMDVAINVTWPAP